MRFNQLRSVISYFELPFHVLFGFQRVREQVIHVLKNGNRASLNEMSNYIRSSGFGRVRAA